MLHPQETVCLRLLQILEPGAHPQGARIVPSGTEVYTLPEQGAPVIQARQDSLAIDVIAANEEEAARNVGVTGTAGLNYQVVNLGLEASVEEKRRTGSSVQYRFRIRRSTDTILFGGGVEGKKVVNRHKRKVVLPHYSKIKYYDSCELRLRVHSASQSQERRRNVQKAPV